MTDDTADADAPDADKHMRISDELKSRCADEQKRRWPIKII